jgi:MerR family mercuric resistance operon transcriptional regulator
VRALLRLADGSPRRCAEVKAIADAHLEAIRRKVAALKKMEKILATVSAQCDSGRTADCPVIDALFEENAGAIDAAANRS